MTPPALWEDPPPPPRTDFALNQVAATLLRLDQNGSRTARVLRDTIDQLLDGERTGRYAEAQLRKTEKTHMGTLVEINLQRAFDFADGDATDYRISEVQVDCKFSRSLGGWEIPLEAYGHLCLLVWADDVQSLWSAGLVRIREDLLSTSSNRDRKRRLAPAGLAAVRWLWRDAELPTNLLLHLPARDRERIFSHHGGQQRVDDLFRLVQRQIVPRAAVVTVAQQKDAPKRVRDARSSLRREGIVILGHQGDHPRIARGLGLPVPRKGEWVSARVAPAGRDEPSVSVGGGGYRLAVAEDEQVEAPSIDARTAEAED